VLTLLKLFSQEFDEEGGPLIFSQGAAFVEQKLSECRNYQE
jgi:hypothetical protein